MNGTIYLKDSADVDSCIGTTEALMKVAEEGRLPKGVLVNLLDIEHRHAFLAACAAIEKKYTQDCTAGKRPVSRIRMCARRRDLSRTGVESRDRVSQGVRR